MKNPALMYHSVGMSDNDEIGAEIYSVPVKMFEQQMEFISEVNGSKLKAQGPGTIITFDDGDITNYKHAFPILQLLGLKAYFFIIVSKVGTPGYMTWHQIRELKNAGMFIGSHGMTHRILTELNDEELMYELKASKSILDDKLHDDADYFSIPRGFQNMKVIIMARNSGYKAVFTSNPDDNSSFKIGRIAVKADWSMNYFMRLVKNGLPLRHRVKGIVKGSVKQLLGAKRYDKIRTSLLR